MISPDGILTISFCAALALPCLRVFFRGGRPLPHIVTGKGTFDIKASWVSNTTVLGAVLLAALKDLKPPDDISSLNLLFVTLAVVAVVVYQGGVRIRQKEFTCSIWVYLFSAVIALWAAGGQLLTLARVVSGAPNNTFTDLGELVFICSVVLAAIGVGTYAWKAMGQHIWPTPPANLQPAAEWPLL